VRVCEGALVFFRNVGEFVEIGAFVTTVVGLAVGFLVVGFVVGVGVVGGRVVGESVVGRDVGLEVGCNNTFVGSEVGAFVGCGVSEGTDLVG
jgi:hypothetical protein